MVSIFREERCRTILEALRDMADGSTLRERNGRQVADVIPSSDVQRWSLARVVASRLGLQENQTAQYISHLVSRDLVQRGRSTRRMSRWVVMTDDEESLAR